MANQDALNVFRQILAQGQVRPCLCSQFCFSNLHGLTTIVTTVQISVDDVPSDLAKGLVRRGSLVCPAIGASGFKTGMHVTVEYVTHHQACCAGTSITKPPLQGNFCLQ